MRIRTEPASNYHAVHTNGLTLRTAIRPTLPITELQYPEFYDIKITNTCAGGCSYCYQDSSGSVHYADIIDKIRSIFEPMMLNQRPFQIAYGGGEPTMHPDFVELLQVTRELGISPNYTTNGMCLDNVLGATMQCCDGVAVSCHSHLREHWTLAAERLINVGMLTNLHLIISDTKSVEQFVEIFQAWERGIYRFVLLPYSASGRAVPVSTEFDYLFETLKDFTDVSQVAFGAGFHEQLKQQRWLDVSLYEPELMSKYIDLETMEIYPSSFHDEPIGKVGGGPGHPILKC